MITQYKQQVSATFARNHFKEVCDQVEQKGQCVIIKKSTPKFVILTISEYEKIQKRNYPKKPQKISLEELRNKSPFTKYNMAEWKQKAAQYFDKTSTKDLKKNWTNFID